MSLLQNDKPIFPTQKSIETFVILYDFFVTPKVLGGNKYKNDNIFSLIESIFFFGIFSTFLQMNLIISL